METFTPLSAAVGGALIGLAASALLLLRGRIAGVSGILAGAFAGTADERRWRRLFLSGLLVGGLVLGLVRPSVFAGVRVGSLGTLVAAGLLVGFGTQLGGGCTSGHGVCGISRGSTRSIVATLVFMATGIATVFVARHVAGVSP